MVQWVSPPYDGCAFTLYVCAYFWRDLSHMRPSAIRAHHTCTWIFYTNTKRATTLCKYNYHLPPHYPSTRLHVVLCMCLCRHRGDAEMLVYYALRLNWGWLYAICHCAVVNVDTKQCSKRHWRCGSVKSDVDFCAKTPPVIFWIISTLSTIRFCGNSGYSETTCTICVSM